MVAKKLEAIPQHRRLDLWHNSVLWLYKYINFVKL